MLKGVALAYIAREKSDSNFSCSFDAIVSAKFKATLLLRGRAFFAFLGKVFSDEKSISQSVSSSSEPGFGSVCLLAALYFSLTIFGQLMQFSIWLFILDQFFATELSQNLHFTRGTLESEPGTSSIKVITDTFLRPGIVTSSKAQIIM